MRNAHRLRPPNRLPAEPLQERNGWQHAVLRECAEAGGAGGKLKKQSADAATPQRPSRTTRATRMALQRANAAGLHKTVPVHHMGSVRVIANKDRHVAPQSSVAPGRCRNTMTQFGRHKPPGAPPKTPKPPARPTAPRKKRSVACGAAEVCWSEASGKVKKQSADAATPHRPSRTAGATRIALQRANAAGLHKTALVHNMTWFV